MLVYLGMLSFFRWIMTENTSAIPGIKNAEAEIVCLKNLQLRK